MVRIFQDGVLGTNTGEFIIQTTCTDLDGFTSDLAEAFSKALDAQEDSDKELASLGILTNALPIAFKLAGYKAETVSEQRTLVCGRASPGSALLIATAGR